MSESKKAVKFPSVWDVMDSQVSDVLENIIYNDDFVKLVQSRVAVSTEDQIRQSLHRLNPWISVKEDSKRTYLINSQDIIDAKLLFPGTTLTIKDDMSQNSATIIDRHMVEHKGRIMTLKEWGAQFIGYSRNILDHATLPDGRILRDLCIPGAKPATLTKRDATKIALKDYLNEKLNDVEHSKTDISFSSKFEGPSISLLIKWNIEEGEKEGYYMIDIKAKEGQSKGNDQYSRSHYLINRWDIIFNGEWGEQYPEEFSHKLLHSLKSKFQTFINRVKSEKEGIDMFISKERNEWCFSEDEYLCGFKNQLIKDYSLKPHSLFTAKLDIQLESIKPYRDLDKDYALY